jgi:hypothetical protein
MDKWWTRLRRISGFRDKEWTRLKRTGGFTDKWWTRLRLICVLLNFGPWF